MSWREADVLCPYYEKDGVMQNGALHFIACEGAHHGGKTRHIFGRKSCRDKVMETFCEGCWRYCPHADALNRLYEEDA